MYIHLFFSQPLYSFHADTLCLQVMCDPVLLFCPALFRRLAPVQLTFRTILRNMSSATAFVLLALSR